MDRKLTKPVSLSIFLSFSLSISISFSTSLQYQTFSLPQTQTFSRSAQHDSEHEITPETDNILSLELIHKDHLLSASNITREALFKRRLKRDIQRVKALSAYATAVEHRRLRGINSSAGVSQESGEYFTRLGIGEPPKYMDMTIDTGSDVVWLQCAPCRNCYPQSDPIYDPSKSKSFSTVACGSKLCQGLDSPGCNTRNHTCLYQVSYGDSSFSTGELSIETLTFRRNKVNRIAFGCGHDNEGLFGGAAGLLGLGRGKLSFPKQAPRQFGGKFSYCLVDLDSYNKSSILFGDSAVSRKAIFTPMLNNSKIGTFYYLSLNGISVGGVRVPNITRSVFKFQPDGSGGVIIDSGTSVTRLPEPAYVALRDAFRDGVLHLKPFSDYSLFDTCFILSGRAKVKVPTVVLHFDLADMPLPATNYLVMVKDNTACFAFAGTTDGLSVIGNIQQQGFRVVFDLVDNRVGFAPNSCG